MSERIVVTVSPAGLVSAATEGIHGERCLDYIAVLEDLLDADTVQSSYTADYAKGGATLPAGADLSDVDLA